jgi:hypothetical protein
MRCLKKRNILTVTFLAASTKQNNMNKDRHIWEGWTVQAFIDDLEPTFNMIMDNNSWQKPFKSKEEVKAWCKDNQPGYKKHIPEVAKYFIQKAKV